MELQDSLRVCGGASGAYQEALGQVLTGIVSELDVLVQAVGQVVPEGVVEDGELVKRVEAIEKRIAESVLPACDRVVVGLEKLVVEVENVKVDVNIKLPDALENLAERIDYLEERLPLAPR